MIKFKANYQLLFQFNFRFITLQNPKLFKALKILIHLKPSSLLPQSKPKQSLLPTVPQPYHSAIYYLQLLQPQLPLSLIDPLP